MILQFCLDLLLQKHCINRKKSPKELWGTCQTIRHHHHHDAIKWKGVPHNWSFVRVIHRSSVDSPHKDQWPGTLMFALVCVGTNGWANNRGARDLRRHRDDYDVIVMMRCIMIEKRGRYYFFASRLKQWLLKYTNAKMIKILLLSVEYLVVMIPHIFKKWLRYEHPDVS